MSFPDCCIEKISFKNKNITGNEGKRTKIFDFRNCNFYELLKDMRKYMRDNKDTIIDIVIFYRRLPVRKYGLSLNKMHVLKKYFFPVILNNIHYDPFIIVDRFDTNKTYTMHFMDEIFEMYFPRDKIETRNIIEM